jgi:hypothetical protein
MQNEPIEVTIRVTQVLEKLNIPYFIGGSLASTLYGMVRTTQDSDIVAEMRLEHLVLAKLLPKPSPEKMHRL